jgi:hypothetical protein
MRNKFSISLLLLFVWGALPAAADEPKIRDDSPDRYVVKRGDTLWGIAGKYLKDPWRWPDLWHMNSAEIKNPHRIYPGDVVILDRGAKPPQLRLLESRETVRLSPSVRISELERAAIPSIPPAEIEPFLNRPLIVAQQELPNAAKIVAAQEGHVVLGGGMVAYATGIDESKGALWQVFRPGKELRSPGRKERLGYEAQFLGNARVQRFGEISTIEIVSAREEIVVGDKLLPAPTDTLINYAPHAPDRAVDGLVISLPGGLAEVGRDSVVTIDLGREQGIEIGHVLALSRRGPTIRLDVPTPEPAYGEPPIPPKSKAVTVPDERFGLVFVFRVYDKVCYALVVSSSRQVQIGDIVSKP